MSINSNNHSFRYSLVVYLPCEIPFIRMNEANHSVEDALEYFTKKFQNNKYGKERTSELKNIIKLLEFAHESDSVLETIYHPKEYMLAIVLSFDSESIMKDFCKKILSEIKLAKISPRYALAFNMPMQFNISCKKQSIVATEMCFMKSTRRTTSQLARTELTTCKDLLNLAWNFESPFLETMYHYYIDSPQIVIVISFKTEALVKGFLEKYLQTFND